MATQAPIITRIEKEPITLRSALADPPAPSPWDHISPRSQAAETIDAMTQSFGILIETAQYAAIALQNTQEGATYTKEALNMTVDTAQRAQEHAARAIPAPGRRYPDAEAAKHAAKANHYAALAKSDAHQAERAAEATRDHNHLANASHKLAQRAAQAVYARMDELPAGYEIPATNIRTKTEALLDEISSHLINSRSYVEEAQRAAESARAAVQSL